MDESSRASGAFEFYSFDYRINAAVFSLQFSLDVLHAYKKIIIIIKKRTPTAV